MKKKLFECPFLLIFYGQYQWNKLCIYKNGYDLIFLNDNGECDKRKAVEKSQDPQSLGSCIINGVERVTSARIFFFAKSKHEIASSGPK